MSIQRCGTQPSNKGPEEYFTGNVRVDPLIQPPPLVQTLIVPIHDKGHYHR